MLEIKDLGQDQPYLSVFEAMKAQTLKRDDQTQDECWLLEHTPVFTQGQAGKPEHLLNPGSIPVIQTDRGGQVTYHGPGQLVSYFLIDIQRRNLGIRSFVKLLEQSLIDFLQTYDIKGNIQCGAPGVYIGEKKIASIGLRVKNGCTYHGIALNVAMDLTPFTYINPCGFHQLQMTQMKDFVGELPMSQVKAKFSLLLQQRFERKDANIF